MTLKPFWKKKKKVIREGRKELEGWKEEGRGEGRLHSHPCSITWLEKSSWETAIQLPENADEH